MWTTTAIYGEDEPIKIHKYKIMMSDGSSFVVEAYSDVHASILVHNDMGLGLRAKSNIEDIIMMKEEK